jgi:hypothetical protein
VRALFKPDYSTVEAAWQEVKPDGGNMLGKIVMPTTKIG